MRKLLSVMVAAGAMAAAGCGADSKSCSSRPAELAAPGSILPSSCSAQAGTTASIQVNLCPRCSDSSPGCQAEFVPAAGGFPAQIEIAPTFQACEEDRGCPAVDACETRNNRVVCNVALPSNAAGTYDIVADLGLVGSIAIGPGDCLF